MKKKGLIISTVVMVVVLIASLTTATYAWFSSSAQATVQPITMTTTAADGLAIGVNNTATPTAWDHYNNGAVTWDADNNVWKDGVGGVGTSVDFTEAFTTRALSLAATKYTNPKLTEAEKAEITADDKPAFIKAEGNNGTIKAGTIEAAAQNADYLDITFGVTPTSDNVVKQIYGTIAITPTDATLIGMAAAMHFDVYVNDTLVCDDIDSFSGKEHTNNYTGTLSAGAMKDTAWTYSFSIASETDAIAAMTTVYKVRIVVWLEGFDASCVQTTMGTGAEVAISFGYTKTSTEGETGYVSIDNKGVLTEQA